MIPQYRLVALGLCAWMVVSVGCKSPRRWPEGDTSGSLVARPTEESDPTVSGQRGTALPSHPTAAPRDREDSSADQHLSDGVGLAQARSGVGGSKGGGSKGGGSQGGGSQGGGSQGGGSQGGGSQGGGLGSGAPSAPSLKPALSPEPVQTSSANPTAARARSSLQQVEATPAESVGQRTLETARQGGQSTTQTDSAAQQPQPAQTTQSPTSLPTAKPTSSETTSPPQTRVSSTAPTGAIEVGKPTTEDRFEAAAKAGDAASQGRSMTPQAPMIPAPPVSPPNPPRSDSSAPANTTPSDAQQAIVGAAEGRREIAVPQVDIKPLETDDSSNTLPVAVSQLDLLEGAWTQINCAQHNEPDVAPGGYQQSLLIIDSKAAECRFYRSFGSPGKPPNINIPGEFSIELSKSGTYKLGPAKGARSAPNSSDSTIPDGDGGQVTIRAPKSESEQGSWSVFDDGTALQLGSKIYRKTSLEDARAVMRGGKHLEGDALDTAIREASTRRTQDDPGGSGGATPRRSRLEFFGAEIQGQHLAFVIDNSGSMGDDGKLDRAIQELIRLLRSLAPGTRVYIIFFSEQAFCFPQFNDWVTLGTPDAEQLIGLLPTTPIFSGTNPTTALDFAFKRSPRPDQLFLMTDGIMAGDARQQLLQLNGQSKAKTSIDTFAVGADADATLLEAIARDHQGSMHPIR